VSIGAFPVFEIDAGLERITVLTCIHAQNSSGKGFEP